MLEGFLGLLQVSRELQRTSLADLLRGQVIVNVPEFWTMGAQRVWLVEGFLRNLLIL